jgi:predicted nucleic acid-binding protein
MNLDGAILDTNVIIRLLRPDEAQHGEAKELLESARQSGQRLVLLDVVVAETVYVLTSFYGIDRKQVAADLVRIVEHEAVGVAIPAIMRDALARFSATKLHFVDCYLAAMAKAAGRRIATFDKGLKQFGDVESGGGNSSLAL